MVMQTVVQLYAIVDRNQTNNEPVPQRFCSIQDELLPEISTSHQTSYCSSLSPV